MDWEKYEQSTLEPRPTMSPAMKHFVVGMQRAAAGFARHWLFVINGFFGLLLAGALLTPVLMYLGLDGPGRVMYSVYSFTCHQLPERSYFLFTPDGLLTTYRKEEVVAAGADDSNVLTLRQYVGSPEMGWKAGFSDRMFSMYGGAFLAGLLYWALSRRGRVNPIPIWLAILLVIPMGVDGMSHMISEVTETGFRDTNAWAYPFFAGQPEAFFTGTTTGSLNAILRLVTGLLFGLGTMLFAYPLIAYGFDDLADEAERTLTRNEARLRGA